MPALHIQLEETDEGRVTLHLDGTFDGRTAAELRASLLALGERDVVLDFSRVRTFVDVAIGVLTRGMEYRNVEIRGLGGHPERMFRYFGLGTPPPLEQVYYRPEERAAT